MRISELSQSSGVSVATIKYYIREGLLPKGETTSATQARYSTAHLRRLRLIRALVETGDIPLAMIRTVLETVDDERINLHYLFGTALYGLSPKVPAPADDPEWAEAEATVDRLLAGLDWQVTAHAPARHQLTQVLAAMARVGRPATAAHLDGYAELAHRAAQMDIVKVAPDASREEALEYAVVMTSMVEQMFTTLHRLALEDASARRFSTTEPP